MTETQVTRIGRMKQASDPCRSVKSVLSVVDSTLKP